MERSIRCLAEVIGSIAEVNLRPGLYQDTPVPELRDARETDRLSKYLAGIWARREYAWYVATSELRSRQMNSLLGNLWHLINPALQMGVYFLIFGVVLDVTRGVDNFIAYLAVGIFTYTLTQRSVVAGGKSLRKYRGLIQIVSFPRALLPLTTTLTETLAMVPAYGVMLAVAAATDETPKLTWLVIFPLIVVQSVLSASFSLIAARAISHIPDIQQLLPFVFRLGFYGSGVIFNVNAYVENSQYRLLFEINPAYCFIEINRSLVLDGHSVPLRLVLIAAAWVVAAPIAALLWFRAAEDSYGAA